MVMPKLKISDALVRKASGAEYGKVPMECGRANGSKCGLGWWQGPEWLEWGWQTWVGGKASPGVVGQV